jgi:hypothetical protein
MSENGLAAKMYSLPGKMTAIPADTLSLDELPCDVPAWSQSPGGLKSAGSAAAMHSLTAHDATLRPSAR